MFFQTEMPSHKTFLSLFSFFLYTKIELKKLQNKKRQRIISYCQRQTGFERMVYAYASNASSAV